MLLGGSKKACFVVSALALVACVRSEVASDTAADTDPFAAWHKLDWTAASFGPSDAAHDTVTLERDDNGRAHADTALQADFMRVQVTADCAYQALAVTPMGVTAFVRRPLKTILRSTETTTETDDDGTTVSWVFRYYEFADKPATPRILSVEVGARQVQPPNCQVKVAFAEQVRNRDESWCAEVDLDGSGAKREYHARVKSFSPAAGLAPARTRAMDWVRSAHGVPGPLLSLVYHLRPGTCPEAADRLECSDQVDYWCLKGDTPETGETTLAQVDNVCLAQRLALSRGTEPADGDAESTESESFFEACPATTTGRGRLAF
jgi:hypothetical protein